MPQPKSRERARFLPGSRTSLPTKVTFVQAVCAKSGPTIDLPKSSARAKPPVMAKPGCAICGFQPFAHEFHQLAERAALFALQPNQRPIIIRPTRPAVFANVKMF